MSIPVTQPLAWHDLQFCLRRAPVLLLAACKHFGQDVMIAGGFVRACVAHEDINDVDVFVASKQRAVDVINWILKDECTRLGSMTNAWKEHVHETDNAYTLKIYQTPIQFIHRWTFTNPNDAIQSFDFTVSRSAFWWENHTKIVEGGTTEIPDQEKSKWYSVCDGRFYADLAAKRLIYTMPIRNEDAGGSMLRVLKYYQRGYRIPIDSLGAVIARLAMGVRTRAIEEKDEQRWFVPIEIKLAAELTKLLREVDPEVDPRHVAHLPAETTSIQP